jgi:hypothetical protein
MEVQVEREVRWVIGGPQAPNYEDANIVGIGQLACCGLCQEPFFLGAVTLSNSISDS